jgi:DNA-binding CsgD family transcriptional regulator
MIHLAFFANLFSLCAGAVSLTISLFFFLQYRKKVVIWYSALLGTVTLLLLSRIIELYSHIIGAGDSAAARLLVSAIEQLGYLVGMTAGPRFCLQLVGITAGKRLSAAINGTAILYGIIALTEIVAISNNWRFPVRVGLGMPILFGTYLTLCIVAALKLESIATPALKTAVKLFFILSLAVLPLSLIKYLRDLPYLPWHLENSLALCTIAVASIFFAIRYFNQPSFLAKGNISEHFRTRFGTTTREEEIIQLAVQGLSNNDIADKLFISVRTVESHLYKIFQKTGVKNRVQLINLITLNS